MNWNDIKIPHFWVGQIDWVDAYLEGAIERLCQRNGIIWAEKERLIWDLFDTFRTCRQLMDWVLSQAFVPVLPQGRKLWRTLWDTFISKESKLKGKNNLDEAIEAIEKWSNVLLVSNHTSGADTLLMETLAMREYWYDVFSDAVYMSWHAVNLYLIPFLVSSCVNRLQIFSTKYKSMAVAGNGVLQDTGATEKHMRGQNLRSLRVLSSLTKNGGKLVWLYPEWWRGEDQLKIWEPNTICIPDIIAKSPKPLFVLPVYVEGVTDILPVRRNDNEYNEFLEHINRGSGNVSIGRMVPWQSICDIAQKQDSAKARVLEAIWFSETDETKNMKTALIMSLIANLAPNDMKRWVYGKQEVRATIRHLLSMYLTQTT